MDSKHELAMLAALAIIGGHPIVKVAKGDRAIDREGGRVRAV